MTKKQEKIAAIQKQIKSVDRKISVLHKQRTSLYTEISHVYDNHTKKEAAWEDQDVSKVVYQNTKTKRNLKITKRYLRGKQKRLRTKVLGRTGLNTPYIKDDWSLADFLSNNKKLTAEMLKIKRLLKI